MDDSAPKVPDLETIVDNVSYNGDKSVPDVKFLRKMNANTGDNCSIGQFVHITRKRKHLDEDSTENIIIEDNKDEEVRSAAWKCNSCNTDLIYVKKDAAKVCPSCGNSCFFQEITKNDMISQGYTPATTYLYKRGNHFRTWLKRSQGMETTSIPDEIIDMVYKALNKERIEDLSMVDHIKVRKILKSLRQSRYYSHAVQITTIITGKLPPIMTQEQQDRLLQMFDVIQEPFDAVIAGQSRQNMLSYSFLIHKFLEILSWDEYLSYFPLLVSPDKIQIQDRIWKKLCEEVGFEYIKSSF